MYYQFILHACVRVNVTLTFSLLTATAFAMVTSADIDRPAFETMQSDH